MSQKTGYCDEIAKEKPAPYIWYAGQVFLYKMRLLFLCYAINFPHTAICHKGTISILRGNETIVDNKGKGRRSCCTAGRNIAKLTIF